MKLFYNPFKKKKPRKNPLRDVWDKIRDLGNFTWKNARTIDKLSKQLLDISKTQNELLLMFEELKKPKKRGRPRKNG